LQKSALSTISLSDFLPTAYEVQPMSTLCPRCGVAKPFSAFYADKSKSNGRRFICRDCDRERARAYYRSHRAQKLAKVKAYQAHVRDKRSPGKNPASR
jgi:transposase-like protein